MRQDDHHVWVRYCVELAVEQQPGHIAFIPLPRGASVRQDLVVRPLPTPAARLDTCLVPATRSADVPVVVMCCLPQGSVRGVVTLERSLFNLADGVLTGLLSVRARRAPSCSPNTEALQLLGRRTLARALPGRRNQSPRDIRRISHYLMLHLDTFQVGFFGGGYQSAVRLGRYAIPDTALRPGEEVDCRVALCYPTGRLQAPNNFICSVPGALTKARARISNATPQPRARDRTEGASAACRCGLSCAWSSRWTGSSRWTRRSASTWP